MICPMVEESETMEAENVTDYTVALQEEMGDQIQVACLHGKMKQAQKDDIMDRFGRNEIQILVSTTVIEVGIDVPKCNRHDDRKCRTIRSGAASSVKGTCGTWKISSLTVSL